MYEALVARVRYHIQKAEFMGLKEAESTLLLNEAADAIEELWKKYLASEVDNTNLTGWLAEEHAKHLWIPVGERLPDAGERVLCYCRANIYEVMKMRTDGDWVYDTNHVYMHSFVTHWMPLPEPPKEE